MRSTRLFVTLLLPGFLAACGGSGGKNGPDTLDTDSTVVSHIKEETVPVTVDTTTMLCYMAYDQSKQGPRAVVLVLPEWWGLNDYPKTRAKELASLGYLALAVDMYGNGKVASDPDAAQAMAGVFYTDPQLGVKRINAALDKAKAMPQADSSRTAAIGYCFGGSMVLNAARLGSPLDGVVSFHGGLAGPAPEKGAIQARILVCSGGADKFLAPGEVEAFKKQMDSVNAQYTFKEYPGATHAFTNPNATELGKKFNIPIAYNAEADKNSWQDMKDFFEKIW